MKISGLVQTTAPIHITATTDSTITRGNATQTVTFPVFEYGTGKQAYLPGISATHLRGALRRIASDIYIDRLRAAGIQIPAALYNATRHGSTGGSPDTANRTGAEYKAQLKDPLMACFGGGPKMLPGHVASGWALPLTQETAALGMVKAPSYVEHEKLPEFWRLISSATAYSKLDMMHGQNVADIIADYQETIAAILAANDDRRERKKSAKDEGKDKAKSKAATENVDNRRSANILEYQFLVPGALLFFNLDADDELPDAAKGLFIEVARRYFETGRVGGMQRIGFGIDAFNLRTVAELKVDDSPIFRERNGKLEIDPKASDAVKAAVAAFAEWSEDPAALDLELLHRAAGLDFGAGPGKKKKAA